MHKYTDILIQLLLVISQFTELKNSALNFQMLNCQLKH